MIPYLRSRTFLSVTMLTALAAGLQSSNEAPGKKSVRICVPEFTNISTRSVNLQWLRESLVKSLNKRNLVATVSDDAAEGPDSSNAPSRRCDYVLRVEVKELYLQQRNPAGITFGSQPRPDVAQPESLNKRYAARLDYVVVKSANGDEEVLRSIANGEADSELQAAAAAEMFVVNRVVSELKKRK